MYFFKKNYKKVISILITISCCFFSTTIIAYQEIIIENVKVDSVIGTKPVRVIKVVLDGQDFIINSLALTGGDSLKNLMKKVGGHTALNGIFFCPANYNYCHGETFSNFERVFNGEVDEQTKRWPDTGIRGIFGFEKNGTPLFVQNNLSEMPGIGVDINKEKIDKIHFWLGNFPIMVLSGKNMVQYSDEYLDEKLTGRQNRHFICSSNDKKTIYMGVVWGVNLYETADIMIEKFWCWEGLNLDAGASENMIYKDMVLQEKSQHIMDAWVVVDRKQYKKITGIRDSKLPELEPYHPDDEYIFSKKEKKKIEALRIVIPQIVKQQGENFKRKFISVVRKLASTEEIKKNPQKKKFLNELLLILFSIGN